MTPEVNDRLADALADRRGPCCSGSSSYLPPFVPGACLLCPATGQR
jgi:hypothetical protein